MPDTPAPTKSTGDPVALLKAHPAGVAIAGGALLGLVVLLRSRNTAAASTLVPASTANTTGTDLINEIQPEIDALARQIAQPGAGLPTTNNLVPPAKGSGSFLVVGPTGTGIYGPGQTWPSGGIVCQGDTCFTPAQFSALDKYLTALPGGHA